MFLLCMGIITLKCVYVCVLLELLSNENNLFTNSSENVSLPALNLPRSAARNPLTENRKITIIIIVTIVIIIIIARRKRRNAIETANSRLIRRTNILHL